jgi:outer membrane receptor protein involved in Fe transport
MIFLPIATILKSQPPFGHSDCPSQFKAKPIWLMVALLGCNFVGAQSVQDLTDLPIESLLNIEVYSASKFSQKETQAPSALTVITAQDIKDYGYRTLADVVQSVRGVYVSNDRNYSYVGTRGFNIPGDLNTRALILVDGYRLNDPVYDQGPLNTEFPVDIDLIERVEYLPGAGSAIYGNNAFFGVINVITKSGKAFKGNGAEVSGRVASYGTDQERLTYGKQFTNGLEMLLSATRHDSRGENYLYFPELDAPETNNGRTTHPASERAERLFGKFSWQHFTLEAAWSERKKALPIGTYGSQFNNPNNRNADRHLFFNLTYDNQVAEHLQLYARAYHGQYDYPATYAYDSEPPMLTEQLTLGRWWGVEMRWMSTHIKNHKLMLGGEFQDNFQLYDSWHDIVPPGIRSSPQQGFDRTNNRYGIYLQDEMTLTSQLILNASVRYDNFSYTSDGINTRVGLIYQPLDNLSLKLLYGSSFRAPNPNELYYTDPVTVNNPNLHPEYIKTYEAVAEYHPSRSLRLTAVGFHYEIDGLIQVREFTGFALDTKFQLKNVGVNKAWGAEFEAEKQWEYGGRLRASYTWADAYNETDGQKLVNSPSHLMKINFSTPLFDNLLRAGVEAQYTSNRQTVNNTYLQGYPMFNLTLGSGDKLFSGKLRGLDISGSIYNLLDESYASAASDQYVQCSIPQNGRNFRLVFNYRF